MPNPNGFKMRRQTEALLCSQFLAENYPTARTYIQQYVGPIKPAAELAGLSKSEKLALGTGRRRADAIAITPDRIVVIETYIHVHLGKLSQLMTYLELVSSTPELADYKTLPTEGLLVGAQRDPIMDQMAAKFGIEVIIFRPVWVVEYLKNVAARHSRDRTNVELPVRG